MKQQARQWQITQPQPNKLMEGHFQTEDYIKECGLNYANTARTIGTPHIDEGSTIKGDAA